MGTRAQRAARTGKGHGVGPGFCKRSSLGILSPEFGPPPAPYQVQEAERSPEKESIERPKGFSRFGRFRDCPRPRSLAVLHFYSFAISKNTVEAAEAAS